MTITKQIEITPGKDSQILNSANISKHTKKYDVARNCEQQHKIKQLFTASVFDTLISSGRGVMTNG